MVEMIAWTTMIRRQKWKICQQSLFFHDWVLECPQEELHDHASEVLLKVCPLVSSVNTFQTISLNYLPIFSLFFYIFICNVTWKVKIVSAFQYARGFVISQLFIENEEKIFSVVETIGIWKIIESSPFTYEYS